MARLDFKLLFESELRWLRGRFRRRSVVTPQPPRRGGERYSAAPTPSSTASPARPSRTRHSETRWSRRPLPENHEHSRRRSQRNPEQRRRAQRRWRRRGQSAYLLISIVIHIALLSIIYSTFKPPKAYVEPAELDFALQFVDLAKREAVAEPPRVEVTKAPPTESKKVEFEPIVDTTPSEVANDEPTEPEPKVEPFDSEKLLGVGSGGGEQGGETGKSALGARYGERSEALELYGGNTETELAVSLGIAWLVAHQDEDGAWSAHEFSRHCRSSPSCSGPGFAEYSTGTTALALLALLGAGIDGKHDSPHRKAARRGLEYLVDHQAANGRFGEAAGHYMYNHAIATFCVAEAAVMTKDRRYEKAAELGLGFSARAQQPGGGWDYTTAKTLRNDLSVTGWQVMAIYTAAKAGILVDPLMVDRLTRFIRRAVHRTGWAAYADRGMGAGRGGISMTAVGMLSKLYLGWSPSAREIRNAAEQLVRNRPDAEARMDWNNTFQTSYYWYYATLALFHTGGDYWDAWNTYLKREVLPLQRRDGHRKGSWDPDPNWIGTAGGRITSTALGVLMFEAYYRYTPIHATLGKRSRTAKRQQ